MRELKSWRFDDAYTLNPQLQGYLEQSLDVLMTAGGTVIRRRYQRNLPLEEAAADHLSLDPLPDLVVEESEGQKVNVGGGPLSPKQRTASR